MNLEISLVPIGNVSATIPGLLPYFAESEVWARGRTKVDDILRFILNGRVQLWVIFCIEKQKIYGHVITEVKQYPQCKMLVIQYCAGEANHMQYVEDKMYDVLDKFAKDKPVKVVKEKPIKVTKVKPIKKSKTITKSKTIVK